MGLNAPAETCAPLRRTLRLDLQFDGERFEGWQRQASARTVQGEVEAALARILGAPHGVVGCGRTDAGVHALHHVSSFRTEHPMAAADLGRALDAVLPEDIGVLDAREVAPGFHAQKHAAWKWYRYRILVCRRKRPLRRGRVWRLPGVPDLERLEVAARVLCGRHDFRSFANAGSTPGSTVRTLQRLTWRWADDEVHLDAVGDGFLYKMVRTLVGTLLAAAQAADPTAAAKAVLDARDRSAAGRAVPAHGLCLMAVAMQGEPPPRTVPAFLCPDVDSIHLPGTRLSESPVQPSKGERP